jgi:hypothetical protein
MLGLQFEQGIKEEMEDEIMVEHVIESLKDTPHHGSSNNNASRLVLAAAYSQFDAVL